MQLGAGSLADHWLGTSPGATFSPSTIGFEFTARLGKFRARGEGREPVIISPHL